MSTIPVGAPTPSPSLVYVSPTIEIRDSADSSSQLTDLAASSASIPPTNSPVQVKDTLDFAAASSSSSIPPTNSPVQVKDTLDFAAASSSTAPASSSSAAGVISPAGSLNVPPQFVGKTINDITHSAPHHHDWFDWALDVLTQISSKDEFPSKKIFVFEVMNIQKNLSKYYRNTHKSGFFNLAEKWNNFWGKRKISVLFNKIKKEHTKGNSQEVLIKTVNSKVFKRMISSLPHSSVENMQKLVSDNLIPLVLKLHENTEDLQKVDAVRDWFGGIMAAILNSKDVQNLLDFLALIPEQLKVPLFASRAKLATQFAVLNKREGQQLLDNFNFPVLDGELPENLEKLRSDYINWCNNSYNSAKEMQPENEKITIEAFYNVVKMGFQYQISQLKDAPSEKSTGNNKGKNPITITF